MLTDQLLYVTSANSSCQELFEVFRDWGVVPDSNRCSRKATDLQSLPFNHLGTAHMVGPLGLEPRTGRL